MKKISIMLTIALTTMAFVGCSNKSGEASIQTENVQTSYVDSYTSASSTKIKLEGDKFNETAEQLTGVCSDLASLADTKVEGYKVPENEKTVQIMSVNPDGTPGMTTIHAWKYEINENGNDTITIELTEGQNAQNLIKDGARGTILVDNNGFQLIHLKTINVETLEYTDENYENGLFNSAYTGADNKLNEYNITLEVMAIEKAPTIMFAH